METIKDAEQFYEDIIKPNTADKAFIVPAWVIDFAEKFAEYKATQFYKLKLEMELSDWEGISKNVLRKLHAAADETNSPTQNTQ
jgi:hypothetical protein